MFLQNDDHEENEKNIIMNSGKEEGSDSSSTDSSSLPGPAKIATPGRSGITHRDDEDKPVYNDNFPRLDPDQNRTPQLLFNPNEKGTKKQKRCDYDSDDRSDNGLGLEYKRRKLLTTAKRDNFLLGTNKMIDFDHRAIKTWGKRLLFETLKYPEIDSLVGLATSYDFICNGNKINGTNKPAFGQKVNALMNFDKQIPSPRSRSPTKTPASVDKTVVSDPARRNPLLSVSYDSPLPPSHIEYMKSRAMCNILKPGDEDGDNREMKNVKMSFKDSVTVAITTYLEECLIASLLPLAGLHVLRCRALDAINSTETEICNTPMTSFSNNKDDRKQRQRCEIRIDNLTNDREAFLSHPITREQVKLRTIREIQREEENAFQEWTLPPEEAILKLMEQGVLSKAFPYHFVPDASRFWIPAQPFETNHCNGNEIGVRGPSDGTVYSVVDNGSNRMATWANIYKVNQGVFFANKEISDIFLSQKNV